VILLRLPEVRGGLPATDRPRWDQGCAQAVDCLLTQNTLSSKDLLANSTPPQSVGLAVAIFAGAPSPSAFGANRECRDSRLRSLLAIHVRGCGRAGPRPYRGVRYRNECANNPEDDKPPYTKFAHTVYVYIAKLRGWPHLISSN
jgi:hypothetical protein